MLHTSRIDSNRHEAKFFFEIPQKMCCRGLDIRVAQIMETDMKQTRALENAAQHILDAVRRDGAAVRRGEDVGVVEFLFCSFSTSIAPLPQEIVRYRG